VRSELTNAAEVLALAERERKWKLWWDVSIAAWAHYGDIIAISLDPDQWAAVDDAVRASRSLSVGREKMDQYGAPTTFEVPLADSTVKGTPELRKKIMLAYNALAHTADGPEADEDFGVPPPETLAAL